MKKNYTNYYFLLVLLSIFLLPMRSNAQEETLQVGAITRKMIVHAPSGIEENRPLVISMHGLNQTMYDQVNQTQIGSVADANKFVLVYPQAIDNSWQLWGTGDTDFILAIIDEMYDRYGIDRDRVYLSGFSMGGMMSYYAMTQIADKIAAIAPVSGFLMDGPNTNSSRPVPIIHIHGADDDFVPHSRVQECMDAWIERNGCPTTAEVTDPYPSNKPSSTSKKYYWGPGDEGVEMVFISVGSVGHWYSENPNEVFSSQEIWDFLKKFSLKMGVPLFEYASVTDDNPKQVKVVLSESIADSADFHGFIVKVDGNVETIDNVVLGDAKELVINLANGILKDNEVTLAYANGNVASTYGKGLMNFGDTLVDNLLKGASPRLVEVAAVEGGDALLAKFNMKMQVPSDASSLTLQAEYNGSMSIPVLPGSFFNDDSTVLSFPLDELVYRDYELLFSYAGSNVVSKDNGLLKTVSDFPVTNNSNGLPVHVNTGKIQADGITLVLEFSKPMMLEYAQLDHFDLKKNSENVTFKDYSITNNAIEFTLSEGVHFGDAVTISYTPGDVTAADKGPLEAFTDLTIENLTGEAEWIEVPGKIEAEDYAVKSGMQTEETGDEGGGLNLGYIGDGDWVEYAIENNSAESAFQVTFRVASQGPDNGGIVDFYIDGVNAGNVTLPVTGGWQVYQSVIKDISISQGKHYLKVVATKAGFNLNYLEIDQEVTGMGGETIEDSLVNIYPNPAKNRITIQSRDFSYDKVELIDMTGNVVSLEFTSMGSEIQLPANLVNGVYLVKISSGNQYRIKKIIVQTEK